MHPSTTYLAATQAAAAAMLRSYSSSFGLASQLLDPATRHDIQSLYAVVRTADEIVDGAAPDQVATRLQAYEQQILSAPQQHFHTDPIVHAYAEMARRIGIRTTDMQAFFDAMRLDTEPQTFDAALRARYIYGSAEVIGVMCLQIFLRGAPYPPELAAAARRLGNAFQVVNFVRDIGADAALGRTYYPGLDDAHKQAVLQQAIADIDAAVRTTGKLPARSARAVRTAAHLYRRLATQLQAATLAEITQQRQRVPHSRKLWVTAQVIAPDLLVLHPLRKPR